MKLTRHIWLHKFLHRVLPVHEVRFTCNVCGVPTTARSGDFGRETASCRACGSTVRMRSIVHHVSEAVLGRSMPLTAFPHDKSIRGVGLSDWTGYAGPLAERLSYTNTYYHQAPFLDITDVPADLRGTCDFVISTDVFEHVVPPVSKAFTGAFQLLKPGGTLVLTVPFATEVDYTREHFPHLHRFEILKDDGGAYRLVNTRADGTVEAFDKLVFHGGPGDTLEMREFSRSSLEAELRQAGFTDIRFCGEPVPRFGIVWQYVWSIPVVARRP